jgi:hypothetical protein
MFGTRLVERELARHQQQIARMMDEVSQLNQELDQMNVKVDRYKLGQCLLELRMRSMRDDLDDWLRFERGDDDELLDSAIECLVKPRLAAIDEQPDGAGGYVCRLYPDWAAIITHLRSVATEAELTSWLQTQSWERANASPAND